jgi:integrase
LQNHLQEQEAVTVTGHLEEKRGIYQMAFKWNQEDGSPGRKSISTGLPVRNNKKRAEDMLQAKRKELEAALQQEREQSLLVGKANSRHILFGDFMEQVWLSDIEHSLKKTTFSGYYNNTTNIVAPYFRSKGILLKDLAAEDINTFYKEQLNRVKACTVHKYHANIYSALKYAVMEGWITHSVMDRVKRPKAEQFVGKFLNQSEAIKLIEAVKGDPLEVPVIFGAFYGLRRSEAIGLKWSAIDFDANTISIEHTVTLARLRGQNLIIAADTAKSKSSIRTLPLVPEIRARLLEIKAEQEEYKKLCGRSYDRNECEYVCINQLGKRLNPDHLTLDFPKFMEKHGFRRLRFHDLRHSSASLLLACGVSLKQIQEWLGHSSFAITADTYAHLDYKSKISSANAMTWIGKTSLGAGAKDEPK